MRVGRAIVMAERYERAGQRRRTGNARRARPGGAVAPRAGAAPRVEELVVHRVEHGADLRATAALDIRDRDIPVRNSAQEVVRAVDRIDDPAPFERTGERASRLLAEESVLRKRGADLAAQQRLDVAVRVTDEVLRPLELDGQPLAIAKVLGWRAHRRDGRRTAQMRSGHPTFRSFHGRGHSA